LSRRERQLLALVCCDRMPLLAAARQLDLSYQEAAQVCVDALLRLAQTAREEDPAGPASPL
jgi:hypothetical protein